MISRFILYLSFICTYSRQGKDEIATAPMTVHFQASEVGRSSPNSSLFEFDAKTLSSYELRKTPKRPPPSKPPTSATSSLRRPPEQALEVNSLTSLLHLI